MNKILLIAVSVAILFSLAIPTQLLKAQVFDEYGVTTVISNTPYKELGAGDNQSSNLASSFVFPGAPGGDVRHRDDGFYQVSLPFPYEYNGEVYNSIYINVNGYILFLPPSEGLPSSSIPKQGTFDFANYFFYYNSAYPKNIVAPFMGDHFCRTGTDNSVQPATGPYMISSITYGSTDLDEDGQSDVFTVQWKDLNINFDDPDFLTANLGITSSVGNFQVKLYKSSDQFSKQGDIEFCYGQIGGNTASTDTRVITKGCAIGLKGNSGQDGEFADFLNGLYNAKEWDPNSFEDYDKDQSKNVTRSTVLWQPSGGSDYRIKFFALGRNQKEEFWGDGDADLSQLEGETHGNMSQPRFVTTSDARKIIRAISTRMPLPKERRREAYHGDVNHNGRYMMYNDMNWLGWNAAGTLRNVYPKDTIFKKKLSWKNDYYGDSINYIIHDVWVPEDIGPPVVPGHWLIDQVIPSQISSISQVFFEATEYDAALIMHYMGGRLTRLPWLLDSIPMYGKLLSNETYATGIEIGKVIDLGNNSYKVPVYLNGSISGPISIKASINGTIENANASNNLVVNYEGDMLVLAGSGEYSDQSPVCYLTVKTDAEVMKISELRFNDNELGSINVSLSSVENLDGNDMLLQNIPNPFTESTVISINLTQDGKYLLNIYDAMGNVVKTFDNVKSGEINWDGLDNEGNPVAQGVYLYRLTGDNLSISKKMILNR